MHVWEHTPGNRVRPLMRFLTNNITNNLPSSWRWSMISVRGSPGVRTRQFILQTCLIKGQRWRDLKGLQCVLINKKIPWWEKTGGREIINVWPNGVHHNPFTSSRQVTCSYCALATDKLRITTATYLISHHLQIINISLNAGHIKQHR